MVCRCIGGRGKGGEENRESNGSERKERERKGENGTGNQEREGNNMEKVI